MKTQLLSILTLFCVVTAFSQSFRVDIISYTVIGNTRNVSIIDYY